MAVVMEVMADPEPVEQTLEQDLVVVVMQLVES
jgi:hypothetical protein